MAQQVQIVTPKDGYHTGLRYNSTASGTLAATTSHLTTTATASVDTSTATSNKVIIACSGNQVRLRFFGRDSDNDEIRVLISVVELTNPAPASGAGAKYDYSPILTLDCLLSTVIGIAGASATASDRYCDTLTSAGILNGTGVYDADHVLKIYSPGNNLEPGWVLIDPLGAPYLEVQFSIDGGSGTAATEANCEWKNM